MGDFISSLNKTHGRVSSLYIICELVSITDQAGAEGGDAFLILHLIFDL